MVGFLVAAALGAAGLPTPVLHLTGEPLAGDTAVRVTPVDYAPGEGACFLPGPWGDCLDLSAASRFGGTPEQTDPAGGGLVVTAPHLGRLTAFTVVVWAQATGGAEAFNARLLNQAGSWELACSRGRYACLITGPDGAKHSYSLPALAASDDWQFVAFTVDGPARRLEGWLGDFAGDRSGPVQHELEAAPEPADGDLEVGTFAGIRPFRGRVDQLRIWDRVLAADELAAVYQADLAARWSGSPADWRIPAPPPRRFQPQPSDIFFSTRWQQRRPDEALAQMRAFHVDHLLWVYGNDPGFIRAVHDRGLTYQATLNGMWGYEQSTPEPAGEGDTTGRQQDFDGHKVVLPHMRLWSPQRPHYTGNVHSPAFRQLFFQAADQLVTAGMDALQIDDWQMTLATARGGLSGFSPESLAGFRAWLGQHRTAEEVAALGVGDLATFDYRAWLREHLGLENQQQYQQRFRESPLTPAFLEFHRDGVRDFLAALRAHLDQVSPQRYLPVSVNNQFHRRTPDGRLDGVCTVDRVDFMIGETSRDQQQARQFVMPLKVATALGIPQIMQCKPQRLGDSQAALAATYALGQWFRVPWDLYMDNDSAGQPAPRYYGTTAEWGPFYDLLDQHPELFDGYGEAATVGVLFNADEPVHGALLDVCDKLARLQVSFALVGAASREADLPLSPERLEACRYVIALSPPESFGAADRQVLDEVTVGRRVRWLPPDADLAEVLAEAGRLPLRLEAPPEVYAFLRVATGERPGVVVHLVNWNALPAGVEPPDGVGAEVFANVTLDLAHPARWFGVPRVRYWQPGRAEAVELVPEVHADLLRITVPRLATWGLVELRPPEA